MESLKTSHSKRTVKIRKKQHQAKYIITLSDADHTLLKRICKKDETTPGRLIKSVLRSYMKDRIANLNAEVSENQLSLFKNPKPIQYKIDDDL